ncbi:GNAT family N-acetyltransferase [Corynebacterium aquatimens]|uniref:GNAT family N-acetyltransferase n=1 Tax=Corynebacterium aquatimens TaxID=1190508 RepID=UPI0025409E0F|nr:GNAT family N-acetyltransferase [Corynebacterium aquatimens]
MAAVLGEAGGRPRELGPGRAGNCDRGGKPFRREPLAARLLDEVAELAREQGATRIALWVDPDNARARHRYEEFGFVGIEDDPNVMVFEL